MGDLPNPHILNYYLGSIHFSIEHTISTLEATTTLTHLAVGFESSYKSTPVNNRRFVEPLCRCIANLRRRNPNHPLDTLFLQFAKKDDCDAVDQLLVAAKQYGIHTLFIDSSHLPIQSLAKFCRDNTHLRDLTIILTTLLSNSESKTSALQQDAEPQASSAILALDKLMMTCVTFENSKAGTKFINSIAHVTYPLLILINVTVGGGENEEAKKIARQRIVSALLEPSVAQLTMDRECAIEVMNVIEACTTVTEIQRFSSDPRFYVRPDAVQQKLQAIAMRNRELTRFRANPPEYPGDELLKLMRQLDNCPTGRYLLARSFHGMLSAQGLTTTLTEPRAFRIWITRATTAIRTWRSKLFTHEDSLQLHKCLGLLCLCSFAFRLFHIGDNDNSDMAFRSHPELTVATVFLHWLLNVSSFVFALPQQRIKEGTRIWPESRIHTLCFVSRSLATILWAWYEMQVLVPPKPYYWVNTVLVLGNLVAVDYGSSTVQYKSRTIRDAQCPAVLKFCASLMQFWATAHCLMGFRERVSIQFYAVFIMQMTAFLTTLRRKNLIRHSTVIVLYMLQLLVAIVLGRTLVDPTKHPVLYQQFMSNRSATFLVGNTAALLRMMPITKFTTTTPPATTTASLGRRIWLKRKYVVWMLMSLWCIELRKTVNGAEEDLVASWWTRAQLEHATTTSFLALLVFAFHYQVT